MTAHTQNIELPINDLLPTQISNVTVDNKPSNVTKDDDDEGVLPVNELLPTQISNVTVEDKPSNVTENVMSPSQELSNVDEGLLPVEDSQDGVLPPLGTREYYSAIGKMGGRPKIYTNEHLEQIGMLLIDWIKQDGNFWMKDFLLQHGLYSDLVYRYKDECPAFAESLTLALEIQESKIVKGDMDKGNRNRDWMAQFVLKNKHGWVDRQENTVTHQTAPVQIVLGLPFNLPSSSNTHNELPPPAPFNILPQSGSTSS